ncbi:hypothetical protein K488DRAFT_19537, partial [Vararia minispora EC-137]
EEWTAVLKLATRWSFASIRSLAIRNLEELVSPIDRLALARTYSIEDWVDTAIGDIIARKEALSLTEAKTMSYEDLALITAIR